MTLRMNQVHGLGQADILAAIIGPVVMGGADIYRTYAESESSADELKQRRREFASLSKAERERREAQELAAIIAQRAGARQQAVQQQLVLQRSAMRGAWWQQNLPLVLGGAVLIALGVAAFATRKRR